MRWVRRNVLGWGCVPSDGTQKPTVVMPQYPRGIGSRSPMDTQICLILNGITFAYTLHTLQIIWRWFTCKCYVNSYYTAFFGEHGQGIICTFAVQMQPSLDLSTQHLNAIKWGALKGEWEPAGGRRLQHCTCMPLILMNWTLCSTRGGVMFCHRQLSASASPPYLPSVVGWRQMWSLQIVEDQLQAVKKVLYTKPDTCVFVILHLPIGSSQWMLIIILLTNATSFPTHSNKKLEINLPVMSQVVMLLLLH